MDEELEPVPMVLYCPRGHQHVDKGEWATRPHKTHRCLCGEEWRAANIPTIGVLKLPDQ